MFKTFTRGLVLALTLGWLAGGIAASQSQRGPQPPARSQTQGRSSSADRSRPADQEAELEFVDSEQGFWTSRVVNAPVYQDGGSVNSVMFEQRAVRDLRRQSTLAPTRLQDVQVTGRAAPAPTIRIQGRPVVLPAVVKP